MFELDRKHYRITPEVRVMIQERIIQVLKSEANFSLGYRLNPANPRQIQLDMMQGLIYVNDDGTIQTQDLARRWSTAIQPLIDESALKLA